jgi:hypothetical protein
MDSDAGHQALPWRGCPIRRSTDQSLLAAPRGLSQPSTSFIGHRCQGIHRAPLIARRLDRSIHQAGRINFLISRTSLTACSSAPCSTTLALCMCSHRSLRTCGRMPIYYSDRPPTTSSHGHENGPTSVEPSGTNGGRSRYLFDLRLYGADGRVSLSRRRLIRRCGFLLYRVPVPPCNPSGVPPVWWSRGDSNP